MAALIALEDLKFQLRKEADDDAEDERLEQFIEEASDIVMDYVKKPEGTYVLDSDDPLLAVPFRFRAAVKRVAENLYQGDPALSQDVLDILHRDRDPACV